MRGVRATHDDGSDIKLINRQPGRAVVKRRKTTAISAHEARFAGSGDNLIIKRGGDIVVALANRAFASG